jgi:uncharacterized membrane protein
MNSKLSSISDDNPKPEFVAELTPHRSLGQTGFWILMGFVSITCFMSGMMFLVIGAWPVFLFMLLDILIIWAAFKINYRAAKSRERVSIGRDTLLIEKSDPAGRTSRQTLNPFWTRFEVHRHEEIGITSMWLKSKDTEIQIGSFLNPVDRESFAHAFGHALSRAKS